MNQRLLQFLKAENVTQSQFADNIGVARASVSHILAGRNKPGFDFLENMALHYPNLNISWLITGKGRMYSNQVNEPQPEAEGLLFQSDDTDKPVQKPVNKRNISKILVFYDDNSFEEYQQVGYNSL